LTAYAIVQRLQFPGTQIVKPVNIHVSRYRFSVKLPINKAGGEWFFMLISRCGEKYLIRHKEKKRCNLYFCSPFPNKSFVELDTRSN
jgi:hypothetical protein